MSVKGQGLVEWEDATCNFGGQTVGATVSEAGLLECVAPASRPGWTLLEVRVSGQSVMSRGVAYRYDAEAVVHGVSPSVGPAAEGITLTVHGRNFVKSENLTCVFGETVRAQAMWRSSRVLEVQSPQGLIPGEYAMYVAMNGMDSTSTYASYVSRSLAQVVSVVPSSSDIEGGDTVTVTLTEAARGMALHCWFGDVAVKANAVDGGKVACVVPRWQAPEVVAKA